MTAARTPQRVSYEDFLKMENESDRKHEWVDGVVYAMTRGTPDHGELTARMIGLLLQAKGCRTFASDTAIFIEAANMHTYADASLVCGSLQKRAVRDRNEKSIGEAITNPCVIVEVLSASTDRYDRDGKFEAYKKLPSFEQYVLVSQDEPHIEVRTREGGQWTACIYGPGESVRVHGVQAAIDAIYESIV